MDEKILLNCFLTAAAKKGKKLSPEIIKAEALAEDKSLSPDLLVNIGHRFDLSIQRKKLPLRKLSLPSLPVILLLNENKACLLVDVDARKKEAYLQYWKTEQGNIDATIQKVPFATLRKHYSGYCLTIAADISFENRADEKGLFKENKSWFWGTLWEFKYFYKQVVLAAFIINLLALALPLFIMNVYDRVIPNNAMETLWVLAIGVMIALFSDFILKTLRAYFVDVANKRIDIVLSSKLLKKSLNIDMAHQPLSTGVRADHIKDFESVRNFFSSMTLAGLVDMPFLLLFIAVIGYVGGPLYLIPITVASLIIASSLLLSIPLNHYVKRTFVGSAQKAAILFESILSVELIKSVASFGDVLERWQRYSSRVANDALKSRFYSILALNLTGFLVTLASVSVVIGGVYLIKAGELSTGALIACVILVSRALHPLAQTAGLLTRIQQVRCSLAALDDIMKAKEERPENATFINHTGFKGLIEFDNVSFQYPGQTTTLLKNISFTIQPGEHIAILGNIASGKSTLLKLIMGFYQPTQGTICLDGIDIKQIDPIILRHHMGYLEQSPKLLFGTALSNITLKNPNASDAAILKAARLSGVDQFLNRHPDGFNLNIAEQGKGLSGGQVQTLALARALLLDPPILLFDEPSNAMDLRTEQHFSRQMRNYLKGKTALFITHKRALLDLANRLIVLQKGTIVMDGKKDDVLKNLFKRSKEAYAHENA